MNALIDSREFVKRFLPYNQLFDSLNDFTGDKTYVCMNRETKQSCIVRLFRFPQHVTDIESLCAQSTENAVNHPALCKLIEVKVNKDERTVMVISEEANGDNFSRFITVNQHKDHFKAFIVSIMKQLMDLVGFLHEHGQKFVKLSPENIFVEMNEEKSVNVQVRRHLLGVEALKGLVNYPMHKFCNANHVFLDLASIVYFAFFYQTDIVSDSLILNLKFNVGSCAPEVKEIHSFIEELMSEKSFDFCHVMETSFMKEKAVENGTEVVEEEPAQSATFKLTGYPVQDAKSTAEDDEDEVKTAIELESSETNNNQAEIAVEDDIGSKSDESDSWEAVEKALSDDSRTNLEDESDFMTADDDDEEEDEEVDDDWSDEDEVDVIDDEEDEVKTAIDEENEVKTAIDEDDEVKTAIDEEEDEVKSFGNDEDEIKTAIEMEEVKSEVDIDDVEEVKSEADIDDVEEVKSETDIDDDVFVVDDKFTHEFVIERQLGFGFSINGGVDRNAPLTICKIASCGDIARDGRIKEGDIIVKIDDLDCTKAKHMEAVDALRSIKSTVKLVIRRTVVPDDEVEVITIEDEVETKKDVQDDDDEVKTAIEDDSEETKTAIEDDCEEIIEDDDDIFEEADQDEIKTAIGDDDDEVKTAIEDDLDLTGLEIEEGWEAKQVIVDNKDGHMGICIMYNREKRTIRVSQVDEKSIAYGKLLVNDVILKIGESFVKNVFGDFRQAVLDAGRFVRFTIKRQVEVAPTNVAESVETEEKVENTSEHVPEKSVTTSTIRPMKAKPCVCAFGYTIPHCKALFAYKPSLVSNSGEITIGDDYLVFKRDSFIVTVLFNVELTRIVQVQFDAGCGTKTFTRFCKANAETQFALAAINCAVYEALCKKILVEIRKPGNVEGLFVKVKGNNDIEYVLENDCYVIKNGVSFFMAKTLPSTIIGQGKITQKVIQDSFDDVKRFIKIQKRVGSMGTQAIFNA